MQLTSYHLFHNYRCFHETMQLEHEGGRMLLKIYGVRVLALVVASCLWVLLTLASGFFTVAMVILVGIAVGNAHHLLSSMPKRAHHSSALLLTLLGGIGANVLAGLALFSTRMGVGYGEVLASRRIPVDLPVLIDIFVRSFRPEDGLFYVFAALVTIFSARALRSSEIRKRKGMTRVY